MHTKIFPTAVTKITISKIMLIIIACNDGNDSPESEVDDVDGTVAVLVPYDEDDDDCVDSSFVTCDSEAIVKLAACNLISSNFKCSIQIDK